MRMTLGALALSTLPVCAWAQDGSCPLGDDVQLQYEGRPRTGYVYDGPNASGECLVVIPGILYDSDIWVPADQLGEASASAAVAPAVAPVGVCVAGAPVSVEWHGQWYPGHVLEGPRPDGSCYITYDGYDSSWDEWATPDRLQAVHDASSGGASCVPGAAVNVEWHGQWYPGHVLEGPRPDGSCYITYDGYDSSWDEWATPDRLQIIGGVANVGGPCVPGAAVSVEWQGQWYAAHVVQGPRGDGSCYITYDGYDSSWDEWATPDRVQAAK